MDDNIIEHYTNQSAFLIEISEPVLGQFQVTLAEVWKSSQSPVASLNYGLRALLSRYSRNCEWFQPKRTKVPDFWGFSSSKKVDFSILSQVLKNVFEFNIVSYRAIMMNSLYILNVNRF